MLLIGPSLLLLIQAIHGFNIMENPNLFEGDMLLTDEQKHDFFNGRKMNPDIPLAATNSHHWPRVIPYSIHSSLAGQKGAVIGIAAAIADYERLTCLRFTKRTNEPGYIEFYLGSGCSSPVGYFSRRNGISLGYGCWGKGTIMHEIAHSLGFYHEQSRPDRDDYVEIIWSNIANGMEYNFRKSHSSSIDSMNVPYDYESVMHYGRYAFGSGRVTIETKDKSKSHVIGRRSGFSQLDILQMNLLYKCPGFTAPPSLQPPSTRPTSKQITTPSLAPGTYFKVELKSEGCDDPVSKRTQGYTCGKATIMVNGKDYSRNLRGFNVVSVDLVDGRVVTSDSFDTHEDSKAPARMSAYIDAIPVGRMVLIAVQDEASMNISPLLLSKLSELGGINHYRFGYRGSYALIGYKGKPLPSWVAENFRFAREGPTLLSGLIPFTQGPMPTLPTSTTPRPTSPSKYLNVYVKSVACDDPKKFDKKYPCGRAVIKLNGWDYSGNQRGHNIVAASLDTGFVYSSASFDTHGNPSASQNMVHFIDSLKENSIVLVAIQDEGSSNLQAELTRKLALLGGASAGLVRWRHSYALIGFKGKVRPSWVKDAFRSAGMGPTELADNILLGSVSPATLSPTTSTTATNIVPTPPVPSAKPGQCGVSPVPQSRVIGGKDAVPGAWPWQIALLKGDRFICGGALINTQWVVTASHCVLGSRGSGYTVVLGEHDRSRKEGTEVYITVEKEFMHPQYSKPTPLDNDIALLKLSKPVQFTSRISPVCLPRADEIVPVGSSCYITGWGKIIHPGNSHLVLQQAILPVRGKAECSQRLKQSPGGKTLEITDQMLCAGELGTNTRKSGCHGDSGGPYVCQTSSGVFQLHGAVSWGSPRCNIHDRFTVFARITALRTWIDKTMKEN